jgi:hypothetical protein
MRSLYDCLNARVRDKKVHCSKGKKLPASASYLAIARGDPLHIRVCQFCNSFDSMGGEVEEPEKGWTKRNGIR